jgi:hypothetical protein
MKNTKARSIKRWRMLFALVLVLVLLAPVRAPQTAHAAGQCPAPGTGIAGALNMIHDATMLTIPMARDNYHGNDGMTTAVENTACPSP